MEQIWGVSLNSSEIEIVAKREMEVSHHQPNDIQSRIAARTSFSEIRKEERKRSLDCMLQLRRVKRAAAGRGGSMTLKECDQKIVAVVVAIQGVPRVLRGTAAYFVDSTLGNCLRINIDDSESAGAELLLRESEWRGKITPDTTYGCDAVVYLDQNRCPS